MFELRPLSESAIPRAIAKAERYRLLNEPQEADSICRDILNTDPDNQEVLTMLLLAITDQFGRGDDSVVSEAHRVVDRIRGEYERAYYSGIVCERWIKAQLNEDAVLRWNACVRFLERNPGLFPTADSGDDAGFSDAAPPR
jgi:hypothetical protein